eukprot:COSAG04_NODE_1836_length_5442_cov_5.741344_6_plen_61_part_00
MKDKLFFQSCSMILKIEEVHRTDGNKFSGVVSWRRVYTSKTVAISLLHSRTPTRHHPLWR